MAAASLVYLCTDHKK